MKRLVIALLLTVNIGCEAVTEGTKPPKFSNGQKVRTVENKLEVVITGTACDTRMYQSSFESCRYRVKLPFRGYRTMMFEEAELEEIQ